MKPEIWQRMPASACRSLHADDRIQESFADRLGSAKGAGFRPARGIQGFVV